ncbi:hypothetical protein [Fimbriiglobus ruber]|uniref:ATP-binding protein n=1 Tax=Fimbriiglobus ruber TaxID=1908690 RepID=A0A225DT06_9BACT|nr:hypothetical protein [Fimbriiglobus ruber]OWK44461.1 hypothetical protein FRUB_02393 [Fimbriiglobus ruber]
MTTAINDGLLAGTVRDSLKRAGNPFRNYFARNPDDEVCARYHVPELFAAERDLLHAIIDLYRYDPMTHSEVVPILGNKGAGKTHLLHSIKHGTGGQWQLLVTPGVYQKDTDFLEYLLFQIIDTLLGGGKQKGSRPLDYVGDLLVRRQLAVALHDLSADDKVELFPPPGFGRWARRLGLGTTQAGERAEWLAENLSANGTFGRVPMPLDHVLREAGLPPERACELLAAHAQKTEPHNAAGLMRRQIYQGFARAVLLKNEGDLANFLTYGFAELDFQVRPARQDLVLALLKVLTDVFRGLKIPVVVAFDQLEDLLLARRSDDAHKIAEAFFAGIVQGMHQIDGLCFLVFAERGLWNRFVPSLDGYIQDRLNNPVHVPRLGTVKAIRLEAPAPDLVRRVVEARLRPVLDEVAGDTPLDDIFPFADDQVMRIAKTEPTLRDMLQQFRHLFDHLVYDEAPRPAAPGVANRLVELGEPAFTAPVAPANTFPDAFTPNDKQNRINSLLGKEHEAQVRFKSVTVVEHPANEVPAPTPPAIPTPTAQALPQVVQRPAAPAPAPQPQPQPESAAAGVPPASSFPPVAELRAPAPVVTTAPPAAGSVLSFDALADLWDQEFRSARRKIEPDGALTGATRELQAALGTFLTTCHEHGVKVGPWRLQHVVPEWPFGDHPTYGAVALAHWACKDGQPWRVAVGLFLARGAGKPKDLEVKLAVMDIAPQVVDHLILLRPEDDLIMTGKSKTLWQDAERRGQHARLEAVALDGYAQLYSFPRWLAAVRESLPEGAPLPNLADLIQEKAEKLLEQVCLPIQG